MDRFLKFLLPAAQVIFLAFLVYYAFRLGGYHLALVSFPYPIGLREGASMISTVALVHGLNPFDMSLQPQFMNQYGIIYSLIVWPWAEIFGTTILLHRIVIALFILASCVLVFLVLRRMKIPILLNIWAVVMLYSSLLFPGTSTPTIDPGAVGMFFLLMTVFIPWFCNYSYRSLIISVLFGILAFYTKLYTFFGALIMLSYLFLFVSKFKGLVYGFLLAILLGISIAAVNQILPAYFDNCFFSHANMEPAWASIDRLHSQLVMYWGLHQWTLILMVLFMLLYVFNRSIHLFVFSKNSVQNVLSRLKLSEIKEPLIKLAFPLVLYAVICSSFILYNSLGRHTGAMMWYFFQLLSPFLLIAAVWLFSRNAYWPILCVPFLAYNLHVMTALHDQKIFDKNMTAWNEISVILSMHQKVLNTPLIAPLLIQEKKDIVDDGQAEYFVSGGQRNYWMKGWLKEDDRVYLQAAIFFEKIREMVDSKSYDLIMLQPSLLPMGIAEEIKKYYKFEGQLIVYAPQDQRPYAVTVWLPR